MKILLSLVVSCGLLQASVSVNTNWEVRPSGNDLNGGGFVSGATGTDFSQQDAPQFSFTDLASANATTTCSVTSASHNFAATDVGNIIHIVSGTNWTAGWYQITSAAANAATLDRACGSAASVSSGTWREGGGFATLSTAISSGPDNTTTMGLAGGTPSGVIWIKTGTYTLTSQITLSTNYSISFVGYNATHGDGGTGPTFTTATNGVVLFVTPQHATNIDNILFTTSAGTPNQAINASNSNGNLLIIKNCTFTGFSNAIALNNGYTILVNDEIKSSTGAGITGTTSGSLFVVGSYIHNNTGNGITGASNNLWIEDSIISNNALGVSANTAATATTCVNSTIANNTGDGWLYQGDGTFINCIFYGNGGFGINANNTGIVNILPFNGGRNNAFGANTSGPRNNGGYYPGTLFNTNAALNDVTLTANPFTSSTNFVLNGTTGGGPVASGAGFPGVFPGGTTTGTINIGAVQSAGGSSSGSTSTGRMVMPGSITFQ